jgi:hypothetical protein
MRTQAEAENLRQDPFERMGWPVRFNKSFHAGDEVTHTSSEEVRDLSKDADAF